MIIGDKVVVTRGEMYGSVGEVLEIDRYDLALVRLNTLGLDNRPSYMNFIFSKEELKVVDKTEWIAYNSSVT